MSYIEHRRAPSKLNTSESDKPTRTGYAHRRPASVWFLIGLQLFLGLGAIFGGGVFILAPDGRLIGMPLEILDNSPFTNFLLPGLLLFFFVGVFPIAVAYSLWLRPAWRWPNRVNPFKQMHWNWAASLAAGVAVIVWIIVQLQFISVSFLHMLYLAWGVIILIVTLLPSVRRHYAPPAWRAAAPKPGIRSNAMKSNLKTPFVLSVWLTALMAAQSLLGLIFQAQYRDVAWIRATWFGNDLVTLLVVVPLLITALRLVRLGSLRGLLLWLGVLGYGAYNYAYYLLGSALSVFFPLYVSLLVLSVATIILALSRLDVVQAAAGFRAKTPVRIIGGYLEVVAFGLSLVWFGMWAAYIFAGRPTPVETEAFKLVAALDTAIMVPLLAIGGILLWRRDAWGGILAGIAGIQGSLYLLVLSANSVFALLSGRVAAPGELPIWGVLAISTATATAVLLSNVQRHWSPLDGGDARPGADPIVSIRSGALIEAGVPGSRPRLP